MPPSASLHALWSLSLLAGSGVLPSDGPVETTLANGVVLRVIHAPRAERESIVTFLPIGLAEDDRGRAQWSHLVEHVLLRSTDPDGLGASDLRINGETSTLCVHLEAVATPDRFEEALGRHAAWLACERVEPDVLAREKERIAAEVANTSARGFAHKWAAAAWNQVVRHGAGEARVMGDVEDAVPRDVEAYILSHVPIGPEVLIVAAGPVEPEDVIAAARERMGSLDRREAAPVPRAAGADASADDLVASWDLAEGHYLEWLPLAESGPEERIAGSLLARYLSIEVQSRSPSYARLGAVPLVSADLRTPEGRHLVFSVGGVSRENVDRVRELLKTARARVAAAEGGWEMIAARTRPPRLGVGAFNAVGAGASADVTRILTAVRFYLETGIAREECEPAFAAVDDEFASEYAGRVLDDSRIRSLLLVPATGDRR